MKPRQQDRSEMTYDEFMNHQENERGRVEALADARKDEAHDTLFQFAVKSLREHAKNLKKK